MCNHSILLHILCPRHEMQCYPCQYVSLSLSFLSSVRVSLVVCTLDRNFSKDRVTDQIRSKVTIGEDSLFILTVVGNSSTTGRIQKFLCTNIHHTCLVQVSLKSRLQFKVKRVFWNSLKYCQITLYRCYHDEEVCSTHVAWNLLWSVKVNVCKEERGGKKEYVCATPPARIGFCNFHKIASKIL